MEILIIEAHQVVRKGLEYFIEYHVPGTVFAEAGTLDEALRMVTQQDWTVAILGSLSCGQDVFDVLKSMKRIQPRLPFLLLGAHSGLGLAIRAYQAGAAGYITKDSPREELVKAVTYVSAGRAYVSPQIAEGLAAELGRSDNSPQRLSRREFELVRLIGSGKTMAEIAGLLGLSNKTLQTYRARALEKLHMKNNTELVRYAIRNRLTELPQIC
ncbi:MAG TPA: response regulator transcription factor [Bryobacteraceae bacterium]|nr:response regulator transcription factor [Bryobacteraceae bacterium]